MRRNVPDWYSYWKDSTDLEELLNASENINKIYDNIRNSIGRVLMSEEMLEIQESLEQRIDELQELSKRKTKIAA